MAKGKTDEQKMIDLMKRSIKKLKFTMTPEEKNELSRMRLADERARHTSFLLGGPIKMWLKKCGKKKCTFCKDWTTERRNI